MREPYLIVLTCKPHTVTKQSDAVPSYRDGASWIQQYGYRNYANKTQDSI